MPGTRKPRTTARKDTDPAEAQFRLRLENSGKWVAWSEDGKRVVASAEEFESLLAAVRAAGGERVIWEWLPPLDQARYGGAL